ncbi:sporulation initiation factor Spo0A C-terminal domain-containing protein [uncultured Thomasclavelia sp.]|uniref:sporulation initiation factor Spo0A C-terminal domain-containing protein n=1 Tax=uncultured Thomasclavelia sp. TaxID=3025759 RepID=UPI0025F8F6D7|nr:sporulation initiation factor Spo0A C-terminal domain-containing protein [uncultured Thomasclavelia sp.]
MDNEAKIVILTEDLEFKHNLVNQISKDEQCLLKADFKSGCDCVNYLSKNSCNVLIVDLILMEIDGIGVINKINQVNSGAYQYLICTSDFASSMMFEQLEKLDVDYYIKKPLSYDYLIKVIHKLIESDYPNENRQLIKTEIEDKIHDLLTKIGIPRHLKGCYYLQTGINLVMEDINILSEITKELYPTIARIHGTTASRVEQAIRHAIKNTWENGNKDILEHIFGYRYKHRPCNSEFISTIVDKLLTEKKNH